MSPADRTHLLPLRRHVHGRFQIVAVGAAVAGEPGEHQPKAVEELRTRAECTADARKRRSLMQGQGCRHVKDLVHGGAGCLGHAAAGIGRQRFQIAPRSFRVQHAQGERRLAGTGYAGDADDLPQRDVHVDILQIMHAGAPDQDALRGAVLQSAFARVSVDVHSLSACSFFQSLICCSLSLKRPSLPCSVGR